MTNGGGGADDAHVAEKSDVCAEIERLARSVDAWGCTAEEVARLEADHGLVLPAAYRCFLLAMGRDGGGCFDGELVTYPYILGSRVAALNLLEANREDSPGSEVFRLPDDALVISFHDQGYAFKFIRTALGDRAPVEVWSEGSPPERSAAVDASFLEHVRSAVVSATEPRMEQRRRQYQRLLRRAFDPSTCPRAMPTGPPTPKS